MNNEATTRQRLSSFLRYTSHSKHVPFEFSIVCYHRVKVISLAPRSLFFLPVFRDKLKREYFCILCPPGRGAQYSEAVFNRSPLPFQLLLRSFCCKYSSPFWRPKSAANRLMRSFDRSIAYCCCCCSLLLLANMINNHLLNFGGTLVKFAGTSRGTDGRLFIERGRASFRGEKKRIDIFGPFSSNNGFPTSILFSNSSLINDESLTYFLRSHC